MNLLSSMVNHCQPLTVCGLRKSYAWGMIRIRKEITFLDVTNVPTLQETKSHFNHILIPHELGFKCYDSVCTVP